MSVTQVPDQDTTAVQPVLSQEITALLSTAGCTAKWTGFSWSIARRGKSYVGSSRISTFDDWRATVSAIVEATG